MVYWQPVNARIIPRKITIVSTLEPISGADEPEKDPDEDGGTEHDND